MFSLNPYSSNAVAVVSTPTPKTRAVGLRHGYRRFDTAFAIFVARG
jgi:hypothetical protein